MRETALLAWYAEAHRRLPWRTEVSAYRTLVSELMCQQTRVETVLPYFERFMDAFPTVEALADAPTEAVLTRWAGLGYYSRARNLQRAAQAVVAGGGFPRTVAGLRALPGVGPYTAGAIASIVFGADEPVVDGNVERVLSRWYAQELPTVRWSWERARAVLAPGRAGEWNQALMELGARVCTPRAPRCGGCPVATGCLGRDSPERYPGVKLKKAVPRRRAVAACVLDDGRVLLVRRPEGGRLGGLWELPGAELDDHVQPDANALVAALRARLGLAAVVGAPLGTVAHTFSHLHLDTTVFTASLQSKPGSVASDALRWVHPAQADDLPLSTLARKTLGVCPGWAAR